MYTSYIGLKFLNLYNHRTGNSYSAAEFFDKEMFPLFFDDTRHLMHVSNSPFFQKAPEKELKLSALSKASYQYEQLKQKVGEVADIGAENADASIYVGFSANGPEQITSGQVSSLQWKVTSDELYASWIGNALAAGVEGGECLLLDSEPVLWHIYHGWKVYRNYLRPVTTMDGRQIETWNGYWLAKGHDAKAVSPPVNKNRLDTYPWLEVVARLLEWHSGETIPAYIFSLGKTNKTFGFINFHLPQVKRLRDARHAVKTSLFSTEEDDDALFWERYEPELLLRDVCQLGELGLRGLRPKDYGKLMEGNFGLMKVNDKNRNTFFNIETWILAMLNNKSDLQKLAADLAAELAASEASGTGIERGKTSDKTEIKALFDAKGLTFFIMTLTGFLEKRSAASSICRSVVDQTIRIPGEQFPLFKALLRFEYVYLKSNN